MKFRVVILDVNKGKVLDKVIDTDSDEYKLIGGTLVIQPRYPVLVSQIIVEPNPDVPKKSFFELPEEEQKRILKHMRSGANRETIKVKPKKLPPQ